MLLQRKLLYAVCGLFLLIFPLGLLAQSGQPAATSNSSFAAADATNTSPSAVATETASAELPDSPGAVRTQVENPPQQQTSSPRVEPQQQSDTNPSITLAPQSQDAAAPGQSSPEVKQQRPVGTAAAETPMVSGTTAAQPAGFAIAPAKQHRVRTLVIKVGAIAGAAVALGTTMALTMATPSKPPGAH